jgi:hypothetical protein
LVEMMGLEDSDIRAAAVAVIYNYVEVDIDARERIASEKWWVESSLCSGRVTWVWRLATEAGKLRRLIVRVFLPR